MKFSLNNRSKLFFLATFSSGATNFVRSRVEILPVVHTQALDAHNHPFFNKRAVSFNFTDIGFIYIKHDFLKS